VAHLGGDRNNQKVAHEQKRNADRIHRGQCTASPRSSAECVFGGRVLAG
jgi:hypothetical protein